MGDAMDNAILTVTLHDRTLFWPLSYIAEGGYFRTKDYDPKPYPPHAHVFIKWAEENDLPDVGDGVSMTEYVYPDWRTK
jgi:hypothetical protein